jgi:uncharacterized membrane protein
MIAIALTAISPFHVLYAQEARPYSLWTLIIVLSSWALLRALRLKNTRSWSIYSVTTALGFYTFLYSCFVSLGQGIYVFCLERFRWTKTVKEYLLAISIGCIFFVPWILVILFNQDSEYTWQHVISLSYLLEADVKFQFIDKTQDVPTLPDNFSDYFFYNVTPDSIEAIQQKYAYRITPVIYQSNKVKLWHLNVE